MGAITTLIFTCGFLTLLTTMRYNGQCKEYALLIGKRNVTIQHYWLAHCDSISMSRMYHSYEIFWGTSLVCFISAIYHAICFLGILYDEKFSIEEVDKKEESDNDNKQKEEEERIAKLK